MIRLVFVVTLLGATSCFVSLKPCDSTCEGCCRDGICEPGTQPDACGSQQAACVNCGGKQCVAGVCSTAATGGGGGRNTGGGGNTGGGISTGGGSATGGGSSDVCALGLDDCSGKCVSLHQDRDHCGQCGNACSGSTACVGGQCLANPSDCRQQPCLTGFYCDLGSGQCRAGCSDSAQCPTMGTCNPSTRTCECNAGTRDCGGGCVPADSTQTCGTSCRRCEREHATASCTQGACAFQCDPGFHECGGTCAPDDSTTQCGASCTACPAAPANASMECALISPTETARACSFTCAPGSLKCGTGCCRVTALAVGESNTCAVTSAGTLKCWGSQVRSSTPVDIAGIDAGVTGVGIGYSHTCALRTDGRIMCWGGNTWGQLGDGTGDSRSTPGFVSGSTTFSSVAAGAHFACGITTAGGAKCWGDNMFGQLGMGSYSPSQCTVGDCHPFDVPYAVVGLSGVTKLQIGWGHVCALTTGGTFSCWGRNWLYELGTTGLSRASTPRTIRDAGVTDFLVAGMTTCADDGSGLNCWGSNTFGELGVGQTTGTQTPTPALLPLVGRTSTWSGTGDTRCASTNQGFFCWGANDRGQVGDGTQMNRNSPVAVPLAEPASVVVTSDEHTCALTQSGGVWCWGENSSGQLGDGTTTRRMTPTPVSGR